MNPIFMMGIFFDMFRIITPVSTVSKKNVREIEHE